METGRIVLEYCLNAIWLAPLVAGAAWLLVRIGGLRPAAEHRVWLGALVLCLALPALGIERASEQTAAPALELRSSAEPESGYPLPAAFEGVEPIETLPAARSGPVPRKPLRRDWLVRRLRPVTLDPRLAAWFGWVYAGVAGFAALRMARQWWAALRLVRAASPYAMTEVEDALLRELAARLQVPMPRVLYSDRVRSPVVAGASRTVLLLPEGFERCPEAERRAALCHELAHVRRRDCRIHAGVQILMLPLAWHPAVHFLGRRIARTREMVCDQMAAAAMGTGEAELTYARCLLNLARTMACEEAEAFSGVGLGLFRTNKLEERVMKLTEAKRVLTMPQLWVRRVGGVAVAGMVLAVGSMLHVVPVVAQQSWLPTPAPQPIVVTETVATAPPAAISPKAAARVVPQEPSTPAVHPVPRIAAGPTSPTSAEPQAAGAGSSIGDGPSGTAVGTDVFEDDGFTVARGRNAHVQVSKGRSLHRWVGADGEPYESADQNPGDLTAEQRQAIEAEFTRRMAKLDAQVAFLKSPAYKQRLRQLASQSANLAAVEAELAQATASFNSPEFQQQMAQFNTPEFKARMDALQARIAKVPQLDGKTLRDQTGELLSAALEAKLAEAERQAALVDTPQMQNRLNDAAMRLDEASARLEAATKALAEAQKQLQAAPTK